jgi:hypothetical protein
MITGKRRKRGKHEEQTMSFTVRGFGHPCVVLLTLKSCVDDAHAARRRYKKDLDLIKPDLAAYSRQKEVVLGLAPGSLAKSGSSSSALTAFDSSGGQVNAADPFVLPYC